MGMAASQARFLGLTSRKSNVEYQGQQINQQRTALSNESANLYNQMMDLTVPTPPSNSDYYKTTYVLENSASDYASEDYEITNVIKTYEHENEYLITLTSKQEHINAKQDGYHIGPVNQEIVTDEETGKDHSVYRIPLIDPATNRTTSIFYDESDTNAYTGKNGSLSVKQHQIYKADPRLAGYNECCTMKDTEYYFYQDSKGTNHFLTQDQLSDMTSGNPKYGTYNILYPYVYNKEVSTQVKGTLEESESGRYSSIIIENDESYPNDLKGKEYALTTVQEMDQKSYDDAYNDYEYDKTMYEKTISDINAQTEIIQKQDQQLELRLKQLDTEEEAIKTEMEAVGKVIEGNVQKTFNAFSA